MELLKHFVDFILHIDRHLFDIVREYDTWTYAILFVIVFCETGLVVTPLLPGDSLLFAAGTIASGGGLDMALLMPVLFAAVFCGDNVNYFAGKITGPAVFEKKYRLLKKEYLEKTQKFYEKHGGKTVVIARFIPIIRTFAPFVAGVGSMKYRRFIGFSMAGSAAWILIFTGAGYFFGQIDYVRSHFSMVTIGIILVSVLPLAAGLARQKLKKT